MSEEQKEELKQKLQKFFDEKLDSLTNKFQNDINEIETLMYSYFDNLVIPFREMTESESQEKEKEKEKNKEEHKEKEKEKEKEEKNEKPVEIKKLNPKPLSKRENMKLSKTPFKSNRTKEINFKDKTEMMPKKSTKIFSGKQKVQKNEETLPNERAKKRNITTVDVTKKSRPSKTPFTARRKSNVEDVPSKAKNAKGTAIKPAASKKFTGKGKAGDKKGKNDKKKKDKEEETKEEEKEEIKEEKKEIILKDKSINNVPEELKSNNALFNIYLVLKGKYLTNKEKFKIILYNPTIFKCFGNNVSFLLDEKKK